MTSKAASKNILNSTAPSSSSSILWNEAFTTADSNDANLVFEIVDCFLDPNFKIQSIDKTELIIFVQEIQLLYNNIDYHNFRHAYHVFKNTYVLLKSLHLSNALPYFNEHDYFSLLFSALIHDVDHLGVPNKNLVDNSHPYALTFNDQSVAEMRSIYLAYEILNNKKNDENNELKYKSLNIIAKNNRKTIIELVLATDAANPDRVLLTTEKLQRYSNDTGKLDLKETNGRSAAMALLLKVSDIGATMQHPHVAMQWAERFYKETAKANGGEFPTTPKEYIEDQTWFLSNIVNKLLVRLSIAEIITNDLSKFMLENLNATVNLLQEVDADDLINEWKSLDLKRHVSPNRLQCYSTEVPFRK